MPEIWYGLRGGRHIFGLVHTYYSDLQGAFLSAVVEQGYHPNGELRSTLVPRSLYAVNRDHDHHMPSVYIKYASDVYHKACG